MPEVPAMPRKTARQLTPTERAKWVISLYIKAGADPKKIPSIAKRASLTVADATKLLKRKSSQQQIHAQLEHVRMERFRQQVLKEAARLGEKAQQEALSRKVDHVQQMKIEQPTLEHELMRLAVGLDPDRHPIAKRQAIESAFVILGVMQSGTAKRIMPLPSDLPGLLRPSVYASVFDRSEPKTTSEQEQRSQELQNLKNSAADLYPQPEAPPVLPEPLPTPSDKTKSSRIINIEVE